MIFSSPPQFGQCAMSISNTRLSSLAQLGLGYAGKLLKDSHAQHGHPGALVRHWLADC